MKYKLDLEDDGAAFDGWAFVHFHSPTPAYLLADSLNSLYGYRLERIDDMQLDDNACPLFRHEGDDLIIFLVEPPAAQASGDKMLIIKGETAQREALHIHTDFATPPACDEGDLLGQEHASLLGMLLADFTVASLLDFDAAPSSRAAAKERAAMQLLLDNMLTYIEQRHLDLTREERLQMDGWEQAADS